MQTTVKYVLIALRADNKGEGGHSGPVLTGYATAESEYLYILAVLLGAKAHWWPTAL